MEIESGAAAEAVAHGETEHTDTESIGTDFDLTDSDEAEDFYDAPTSGR